ncbi:MAG: hypothetical protein IKL51_05775 [Lachnospiraceae bacterium]|nr:hypothetical protein [Lachnospiraceae bacterium]
MEEKEIQDLIVQLKEENEIEKRYLKKQLFLLKLSMLSTTGIFITLLMAIIILVPRITTTLTEVNLAIGQISNTMVQVEEVFESVKRLVEESEEGLGLAIDSMNSIDFKGLNQSITDLGNVVSPLADFFSKFR